MSSWMAIGTCGGLALIGLYWKYVPSAAAPLESLKEVTSRRIAAQDPVLWPEMAWEVSDYASSPFGSTHYYLLGPDHGPRLVFVHGITAGSPCFPDLIQGLADEGFRVLTFDLFGRGFSDSPGVPYGEALYTSQLHFLVSHLGWTSFHLVGLSLGGGIATSYATHFPLHIQSLTLIAPAGLMPKLPPIAYALQIPVVGPLIWYTLGRRILVSISESNYDPLRLSDRVRKTMLLTSYSVQHHPGFMRAYYSTIQHFPVCGMDATFTLLEQLHPGRVAVLWVCFWKYSSS